MSRIRPGEVVEGRYRLDRLLGEGGYGAVYAATHLEMGTPLALKLLHAHHADSEEATARFRREARNTARLRHPNCVTVFDFGRAQVGPQSEEVFFLAMELLEGQTLADLLRKGPIDPQRAMLLLDQILLALEAAHGLGLIHRDLKPDNVFLVPTGGLDHVKVLDFGIAKTLESEDSGSITASGTVIGTPAFMSPEQCRGTTIDARSDLYSLGCVAWAMLAGQPPFKRDSTLGYLLAHVQDPPGDIATVAFLHEIPAHLRRFIATCLEKDPDARYPTASAARKALGATGQHPAALTTARGLAVQAPPGPRRRKWPIIALGGAVVVVGVVLGLLLTGDDHRASMPTVDASTRPPEEPAKTPPEPAVVQAAAVLEDTVLEDTKSEDTHALEADTHAPLDTLPTEAEVEPEVPTTPPRPTQAELSTHAEKLCTTARRLPTRTPRTVETAAREALTTDPIPNVELRVTQAKTITLTLCTATTPDRECASCTVPPSAATPRPTSAGSKPQPPQQGADSPRTEPDPPQASRPKTNPQPTRPTTTKPPEFERLEE